MTHHELQQRGAHVMCVAELVRDALVLARAALQSADKANANPRLVGALRRAEGELTLAQKENERLAGRVARKIEHQHTEEN